MFKLGNSFFILMVIIPILDYKIWTFILTNFNNRYVTIGLDGDLDIHRMRTYSNSLNFAKLYNFNFLSWWYLFFIFTAISFTANALFLGLDNKIWTLFLISTISLDGGLGIIG